jgi:PAS domain-containing protein
VNTPSQDRFKALEQELQTLRGQLAFTQARLEEAEAVVQAIRSGQVDAMIVSTQAGQRVFTLQGADYIYQCLVEQMGEGAATVAEDGLILYGNQQLACLLNCPLNKVIGSYLNKFIASQDQKTFASLLQNIQEKEILTQELSLITEDEKLEIPVKFSLKQIKIDNLSINSIVITDITESKIKEATKLAQVLNQAIAAIVRYRAFPNNTWIFDYWSEGCEILLGYTAAELIADQNLWASRVYAEDLESIVTQSFEKFKQYKDN